MRMNSPLITETHEPLKIVRFLKALIDYNEMIFLT